MVLGLALASPESYHCIWIEWMLEENWIFLRIKKEEEYWIYKYQHLPHAAYFPSILHQFSNLYVFYG